MLVDEGYLFVNFVLCCLMNECMFLVKFLLLVIICSWLGKLVIVVVLFVLV